MIDWLVALIVPFGVACVAFGGVALALSGVRGTCSRACDRDGRPLCEACPRHGPRVDDEADAATKGGRA
jgi:hypothetical protein